MPDGAVMYSRSSHGSVSPSTRPTTAGIASPCRATAATAAPATPECVPRSCVPICSSVPTRPAGSRGEGVPTGSAVSLRPTLPTRPTGPTLPPRPAVSWRPTGPTGPAGSAGCSTVDVTSLAPAMSSPTVCTSRAARGSPQRHAAGRRAGPTRAARSGRARSTRRRTQMSCRRSRSAPATPPGPPPGQPRYDLSRVTPAGRLRQLERTSETSVRACPARGARETPAPAARPAPRRRAGWATFLLSADRAARRHSTERDPRHRYFGGDDLSAGRGRSIAQTADLRSGQGSNKRSRPRGWRTDLATGALTSLCARARDFDPAHLCLSRGQCAYRAVSAPIARSVASSRAPPSARRRPRTPRPGAPRRE